MAPIARRQQRTAIATTAIAVVYLSTFALRPALADRADEIAAYRNSQPLHSALVQSTSSGLFNWRQGERTPEEAAEKALADCRRYSSFCSLVFVDGKPKKKIQRTLKIPSEFEVYDGVTGTKTRLEGVITVYDAYSAMLTARIVVTAKSGKKLCTGARSLTQATSADFALLCFGSIFKGSWAPGRTQFKLRENQSYINVHLRP